VNRTHYAVSRSYVFIEGLGHGLRTGENIQHRGRYE
jgi:hypothetical protein